MKLTAILKLAAVAAVVAFVGAFSLGNRATAETADDKKWIARCIADNKGEKGATPEIVQKYCACMNEAMDDNDNRTVTQFEKANPKTRMKCEAAAGWK
jgi:hypothetical protein